MTTRFYLNQLKNIDREIQDKQLLAIKYRDNALPTSPKLSDMKVQTSHESDKMASSIVKALDYEKEAEEMAIKLLNLKHHIEGQIDAIRFIDHKNAKVYYNILTGIYIRQMTHDEVSKYIKYSQKQTKRLYEGALKTFESIYGEEYLESCP